MYAFGDIKCVTISNIVATCPSQGQFHPVCVYGESQQSRHKTMTMTSSGKGGGASLCKGNNAEIVPD